MNHSIPYSSVQQIKMDMSHLEGLPARLGDNLGQSDASLNGISKKMTLVILISSIIALSGCSTKLQKVVRHDPNAPPTSREHILPSEYVDNVLEYLRENGDEGGDNKKQY